MEKGAAIWHRQLKSAHRSLRLLAFGFLATIAIGGLATGFTQTANPVSSAEIRQILDSHHVYIQNRQAAVGHVANRGQQVRTEQARVELQFDTDLVDRLTQNSSLIVGQSCIQVRGGTLLISGSATSCSLRVTAGVRGTIYMMTVSESGTTEVAVLEGTVDISMPTNTTNQSNKRMPQHSDRTERPQCSLATVKSTACGTIPLQEGLQITIDADGRLQSIQPLSAEAFTAILRGPLLADFRQPLPDQTKLQDSFQRLYTGIEFPGFPDLGSEGPDASNAEANLSAVCQQTVDQYRQRVRSLVEVQWDPPRPPSKGVWQTVLTYEVTRSGTVQNIQVQTASGYAPFDESTVRSAQQITFPAIPECFLGNGLDINHRFELLYQ